MKYKKAQGLPVNIIVMLIIGIIIFGLGMGLFSKISGAGEDEIERLNQQVKLGITSLECDGEHWICSPAYDLPNGDSATFSLYVANKGDENNKFQIKFDDAPDGKGKVEKDKCGSIDLSYLSSLEVNILSGESAKIPFIVNAKNVKHTPCSFVANVKLLDVQTGDEIDKTSVIVKIK